MNLIGTIYQRSQGVKVDQNLIYAHMSSNSLKINTPEIIYEYNRLNIEVWLIKK